MKNMFQLVLMLATATQVSSLWGQSFTPIRVTAGTANCTDESTNVWLAGQMTAVSIVLCKRFFAFLITCQVLRLFTQPLRPCLRIPSQAGVRSQGRAPQRRAPKV